MPAAPGTATADAEAEAEAGRPGRRWRDGRWPGHRWPGWSSPDVRAVAVLVAVPVAVFVVPALFGHPAIAGDNLLQNFPLRARSGSQLRQGHLPLWNPLIWSGTPLLGGLNAGALYPFTFLFAVLPATGAWVLNLLVAYGMAGLAFYLLARQYRLAPLAALLGAATFAWSGAMLGQLVHLPIVQGWAYTPLIVLAELRLTWALFGTAPVGGGWDERPGARWLDRRPRAGPAVVLLAVTLGCVLLTGEPRGMAQAEIVATVVAVWLLVRRYPVAVPAARRLAALGLLVAAALWAAALGAIQLLPGWEFIGASQRSSITTSFFASGSLPARWSPLLFVPDLFGGGNGLLHQPTFFASYNLPEVTGYVGLLPLVAAVALAVRSFGRGRSPRAADWGVWLVLVAVGLVLAWGSSTPLVHLESLIPLFNKTRLQSRNLGIVDLALAALFAFWVDRLLAGRDEEAAVVGRRRWMAAAPALVAVAILVALLIVPGPVERLVGSGDASSYLGRFLTPWFVVELAVAGAVVALVLGWHRLAPARRRPALVVVTAADLLFFALVATTGLGHLGATPQPTRAAAAAVLGTTGRSAIEDTSAQNVKLLTGIGTPDLNAFTGLPSVEGYGSLIADRYGTVTGAHTLTTLDPCALARGVFDPLRLATLLTLPPYLAPEVLATPTGPVEVSPVPPTPCPGAPAPGTATHRTFYLGQVLTLTSATLVRARTGGHRVPAAQAPGVEVLTAGGRVRAVAAAVTPGPAGGWRVRFAHPVAAAGLVVTGPARAVDDTSSVVAAGGLRYQLNGGFQDALGLSAWTPDGFWEGFARFAHRPVAPPVWLAGSPAGASAHQVSTDPAGGEVDEVQAPRAVTVVRSEAWLPGWHVQAQPLSGGPARDLAVVPVGLVQGVRVPAGDWRLTFSYWPAAVTAGLVLTGLGLVALLAAGVVALVGRRRRAGLTPGPPGGPH